MKFIKIISIYKTSIEYRGLKMAFVTWFGFVFFCGGGAAVAYSEFLKDDIVEGFIGLGMALLYLLLLFLILRSRVYVSTPKMPTFKSREIPLISKTMKKSLFTEVRCTGPSNA